MGDDPAVSGATTVMRSGNPSCAGQSLYVAPSANRYVEFGQAALDNTTMVPFMLTGSDFSQAKAVASISSKGPYRFFGDSACGCDTNYPLFIGQALTLFCPARDECPFSSVTDPYGVGTATCGNGNYEYVTCADNGLFTYGYQCTCTPAASYNPVGIQLVRNQFDVNASNYEIIDCDPLPIHVYSSNLGIQVNANISFETILSIRFYDAAQITAKDAISSPALQWTNRTLSTYFTGLYETCSISPIDVACLQQKVVGFIFETEFTNATDTAVVFYDPFFRIPCGLLLYHCLWGEGGLF